MAEIKEVLGLKGVMEIKEVFELKEGWKGGRCWGFMEV